MSTEAEAGAVRIGAPEPGPDAQSALHAKIVLTPPREGQSATRGKVTQRDILDVARAAGQGAHLKGQLPSVRDQAIRVHNAAADLDHAALKAGRLAWGYVHLLIKVALNITEWILETPARAIPAGIIAFVVWKFR